MILSNMKYGYFSVSDANVKTKCQNFQNNYLGKKRKLKNISPGLAAADDS
jgi:GTP-binding protein EngB required for normal cell division